jgi:uncharacterized protein YukE
MLRSQSVLFLFAVAGLILGGCRTYGDEYDTKPKTYRAMQKAVETFADALDRAETDLQTLEAAASKADTLQPMAEHFESLHEEHDSLLQTQRDRIERLSPTSTYRNLHSAYGATVTEQRMMRQKYQRVLRTVYATVQDTTVQASRPKTDRQYTVRPLGFPTSESEPELTMTQALRGL